MLSTTIAKGAGIDVRRTKFVKEPEIILPTGTYKVEVDEIKPFKQLIKEQDPSDVVLSLEREDVVRDTFNAQFFRYIVFNGLALSDKAKAHLFKLLKPDGKVIAKAQMSDTWRGKKTLNIAVGAEGFGPLYLYTYADVIGPKFLPNIRKVADQQLRALIDAIEQAEDLDYGAVSSTNLDTVMPYLHKFGSPSLVRKYKDLVYGGLRSAYRRLSNDDVVSPDRVREINKITDPGKKRDAIEEYMEDLKHVIQNIQSMG